MSYIKFAGNNALVLLALTAFLLLSSISTIHAQSSSENSVTLRSSLDRRFNTFLEKKLNRLFKSITAYSESSEPFYQRDRGMQSLRDIISQGRYIPVLDSIKTIIIKNSDGTYSVPNLFFEPLEEDGFEWEEYEFHFSGYAELLSVYKTDKRTSPERMLIQKTPASTDDTDQIAAFMDSYAAVFSSMDLSKIESFFSDDAVIVTGSFKGDKSLVEYKRQPISNYLNRISELRSTIFTDVSLRFLNTEVLKNPSEEGIFGFYGEQEFITPNYADTGFVFFIIDASDFSNPKIVARNWLEEPVELEKVIEVVNPEALLPEPVEEPGRMLEASLSDVRVQIDETSEALTKLLPREQGYIQIDLETNDLNVINASVLRDWILDGFFTFSDLDIDQQNIVILDERTLRLPYSTKYEEGMQRVQSEISINGIPFLQDFSSVQSIYLQRLNVIALGLISEEEQKEIMEFMSTINAEPSSRASTNAAPSRPIQSRATDVRMRVDNTNLSMTKGMPENQGVLQIELSTNQPDQINANLVREWIINNTMYLDGITVLSDFIEIVDEMNIRIPFSARIQPGMKDVEMELYILETPIIQYFSTVQKLSLQRLNVVSVKIWTREIQKIYREKKVAEEARRTYDVPRQQYAGNAPLLAGQRKIDSNSLNVRSRVDNSNLSMTKGMPENQGILQIELETNSPGEINAVLVQEWIENNTMYFNNISLLTDFIDIVDRLSIRIPFKVEEGREQNWVQSELFIKETPLIDSFTSKQDLTLQRLNIITIKAISKAIDDSGEILSDSDLSVDDYAFAEDFKFEGKVRFKINQPGVNVKFIADKQYTLYEGTQTDTNFEIQVLEGPYDVQFFKDGFELRTIKVQILKSEIIEHNLILIESVQPIFQRRKSNTTKQ